MSSAAYKREELEEIMLDELPRRGPVCPKCHLHIPQFAELPDLERFRIRRMILEGRSMMARAELRALTGCPEHWAKIWVDHSGRPDATGTTAPCPFCGEPLRTALAKQCPHCLMDWHDPNHPKKLKVT